MSTPEFSPEQALNERAARDEKLAKRHAKQARHMASHAIRMANKGNIDTIVSAKATRRFVPDLSADKDPEVYPLVNDILAPEGLKVERHTLGISDPTDFIEIKLIPEHGAEQAASVSPDKQ